MKRIFIFTGKGGVGKSSVAAAHARRSAQEGCKTLLVSTDMAHNLADMFQCRTGKEVTEASEHLDILEIDPAHVMEQDYAEMKTALANFFRSTNMPADAMEQLNVMPGMDELFCLLKIMDIYEKGDYQRIIVDCAPTGETLSLLKFPELLSWYIEKFFPIEKIALKVLTPISKKLFKVELPEQEAMNDIERMYRKMSRLQALLKDGEKTSIRLVAMPEKMVAEETKRNYMYLNLYNFHVDGLYINRVLPPDLDNSFFAEWIRIQGQYIEELRQVFGQMPVWQIPWFDTDLNGLAGIDRMASEMQGDAELFTTSEKLAAERYEKTADGYQLILELPGADKETLRMHDAGNDIIVKIHNFKRCIPKPNILRSYEISKASFENDILTICFSETGAGQEKER